MGELYTLVAQTQNGDKRSLENLVKVFEPKINRLMSQTEIQNRDDLKQELYLAVIKKSKTYNLNEVPGFYEFKKDKINNRLTHP